MRIFLLKNDIDNCYGTHQEKKPWPLIEQLIKNIFIVIFIVVIIVIVVVSVIIIIIIIIINATGVSRPVFQPLASRCIVRLLSLLTFRAPRTLKKSKGKKSFTDLIIKALVFPNSFIGSLC